MKYNIRILLLIIYFLSPAKISATNKKFDRNSHIISGSTLFGKTKYNGDYKITASKIIANMDKVEVFDMNMIAHSKTKDSYCIKAKHALIDIKLKTIYVDDTIELLSDVEYVKAKTARFNFEEISGELFGEIEMKKENYKIKASKLVIAKGGKKMYFYNNVSFSNSYDKSFAR